MTWNLLVGGEDRFDRILALLARTQPDVLVLQECLGWEDGVRLGRVAQTLGLPATPEHTRLGLARPRGTGRRFHVALVSRLQIGTVATHADPAQVGHCILKAQVAAPGSSVLVLATHFDAKGEDQRLRDAHTLCGLVAPDRLQRERVLLAGDLNALSRRDPYPPDLDHLLRAAGSDKYGHPPRFEVMELLERQGYIDLLHHRSAPATWVTAQRERGGVQIDFRTDYLLASPLLARELTETRVLDGGKASDHEPVIARVG
jgi:exodeoxyribonuclease-3